MGRPQKFDLNAHQTELIALYTDGMTSAEVIAHMQEKHGVDIPDRTLKRRMKEWGVQKNMKHNSGTDLKPRIQSFWDLGLDDEDMVNILRGEGYAIQKRSVARLRTEMNLKRRFKAGDKRDEGRPARSGNAAASATPVQATSLESAVVAHESVDQQATNNVSAPASTKSIAPNPRKRAARKGPAGTKTPKKPKRIVIEDDDGDDGSEYSGDDDGDELQRVKEENAEIRLLMEALREEADDSKERMLAKAKDDAEKFKQIRVLEGEIRNLRSLNERLISQNSRDERILQVTDAKNTELGRVKNQLSETRAQFKDASVRVFKYQTNCASFLDNIRQNDPNYSTERTEAELLTVDLERVFNASELHSIRSQIT